MNDIIKIWLTKLQNAKTEEQKIYIQKELEKRIILFGNADSSQREISTLKECKPVANIPSELLSKRDKLAAKISKFGFTELQPELDELNRQIEQIAVLPSDVKKYDTYFGEVIWNQASGKIICRDCEFTETEIMSVSNAGLSLSEMDFEIKKHFPDAQLSVLPREEAA